MTKFSKSQKTAPTASGSVLKLSGRKLLSLFTLCLEDLVQELNSFYFFIPASPQTNPNHHEPEASYNTPASLS